MSIRSSFETKLNTMSPALATNWENVSFTPTSGVPYQTTNLILSDPVIPTLDFETVTQRGIFQITLKYPTMKGMGHIEARAEMIKQHFKAGTILVDGSDSILIDRVAQITHLGVDGDRYLLAVSVSFLIYKGI